MSIILVNTWTKYKGPATRVAFTIADVRDLVRLLDERPEWRAEVRRQLLTDEFLAMPGQIAEQRRDIQRIEEQIAE